MSAFKAFGHLIICYVGIGSAVPDDDATGAVLALRDHSLERRVVQWMILGAARHPPVLWVCRRPCGYRPGYEHAIDLEAKVKVVAARGMVLDDERQPVAFPALSSPRPTWLGTTAGPPFTPVLAQGHAKGIPVGGF